MAAIAGIIGAVLAVVALIYINNQLNSDIANLKNQVTNLQTQLGNANEDYRRLWDLLITKTSQGDISIGEVEKFLSQKQAEAVVEQVGLVVLSSLPFKLETQFVPSGWMGDGEQGTTYLSLSSVTNNVNGVDKVVTRIEYRPGPEGWAGIYWLYPDGNWGSKPGKSLVGASKITFLARGENGGEIVEFKSGGVRAEQYKDTLEVSIGKVSLSSSWQPYSIEISNQDLSNVIGAFAGIVAASDNDNKNVTIYIADLIIDK